MARIINGVLNAPSYDATSTPGEYTFSGATYINVADATGAGAYDLRVGFILYIPATDLGGNLVPGTAHRYRLTAVSVIDQNTLDGTVLWDEDPPETDTPSNGVMAIISEPSPNHDFGYPVSDLVYAGLMSGAGEAATNADTRKITDRFLFKHVQAFTALDWQVSGDDLILTITHGLGTTDCIIKVYEEVAPAEFQETTLDVKPMNSSAVLLRIAENAAFTGKIVIL